jgi:hypothetical protein
MLGRIQVQAHDSFQFLGEAEGIEVDSVEVHHMNLINAEEQDAEISVRCTIE